jgi:anti-anti-sigma factor
MAFTVTCNNGCAKIELSGKLDAASAPLLQDEMRKLIGQEVRDLVFVAKDLEYIASAGLRVIIFAKQKIGADTKIYFIGAQEAVLNVIKMSGLDNFLAIQESYNG